MKKVLHLTLYLDIGGLERMILVLCREQKRAGWHPSVMVYERATGDLFPQFKAEGVPVTFHPKGKGFSPRLVLRILRQLRAEKIDILHSHDLGALIYGGLVKLLSGNRVRLIHTQHSFQHLRTRKARLYERIFPWFADRVVCVSEDLRRTYLHLGQSLKRLRLVPNGVDFPADPPSAKERLAAKRGLVFIHKLSPSLVDKKWVISLGRLAAVKGPQHAVEVWNAVSAETAEGAALFFVGPESEPGLLARLHATAKKEVYFPGPSLHPRHWLAAADVFLSASEFEGLPMSGLEAVAARVPMVLSRIPGHAVFRGWAAYFPLTEPAAGARLVEASLREENPVSHTEAAAARARLEANCGAGIMNERYLRVYREITPPGPG